MTKFTEHDHYYTVCAWCDNDKHITEGLLAVEDLREYNSKEQGLTDHVRKWISHTICPPCMVGVREQISNSKKI
jgi:hypothetical protein